MQVEAAASENIMPKAAFPEKKARPEPAIAIKKNENIINKATKGVSGSTRINSRKEKEIKGIPKKEITHYKLHEQDNRNNRARKVELVGSVR